MSGRLPAAPTLQATATPAGPSILQPMAAMPVSDARLAASAGAASRDLGQRLAALATRFDERADTAAAEAGLAAGRAAGDADPKAQAVGGGSIWRSAYDRGVIESAGRRVEIMARDRFSTLARENAANPAGFEAGVAGFRDQLLDGMLPAARIRASQQLDALASQFRSSIADEAERQVAQERLASFQDVTTTRLASIERLALNALRDPRLLAELDAERDNMRADLAAMGPRTAFTFGGVTYEADPTRAGAMTPLQMGRVLRQLEDTEREGLAMGAFRNGPRTDGWIAEFERRELDPGQRSGLRPDQVTRLTGTMRAEAARLRAQAREARADAREELTPLLEARRIAIAATGSADALPALNPGLLRAAGMDPRVIAATERSGQQLYTARESINDPDSREAIAARLAPGGDLFAANPRQAVQLLGQVRELNEADAAHRLNIAVADRLATQQAEAEAAVGAGRPVPAFQPIITAEEGRAAGMTPQRIDTINSEGRRAWRISTIQAEAPGASAARLAELEAELGQDGPGAAENRRVLAALETAVTTRNTAMRRDPAAYAVSLRPELQRLQQQALQQGGAAALGQFVARLDEAQAELGVPPALRRALPAPVQAALSQAVGSATNVTAMAAGSQALLGAVGPQRLVTALDGITGAQAETRREAVAVAAMVQSRDPGLSRQIMQGALLLRDNPIPALTTAAVETEADRTIGNAFRAGSAARSQLVSAARAVYAAEMGERGTLAAPFDRSRFAAAIQRVQPMASYGGGTVPLPDGMSASDLTRLMGDLPPAALAGAVALDGRAITPGMVARGGFQLSVVAPGRYELHYGGSQVMGAGGQPFILDLPAAARLPREAPAAPDATRYRGGLRPRADSGALARPMTLAERTALLDADPETLARASEARMPAGQPRFNPASARAPRDELGRDWDPRRPGQPWDAGLPPPAGRIIP